MDFDKQKIICKFVGGSHAYGLDTPTSDIDLRGVFLNTSVEHLVGLSKYEHEVNQKDGNDSSFKEFRHALQLLRGANTEVVEMLFLPDSKFTVLSHEWQLVRDARKELLSSEKLFGCLRGYMQGEIKLANGERSGKLGSKRKEAIDKFGFSPKNFVQYFRLAWAGTLYFQLGRFPVNVRHNDKAFADLLLSVKTEPARFTCQGLNEMAAEWEQKLIQSYENRIYDTKFNEDLANELCLRAYGTLILKLYCDLRLK